MSYLEEQEKEIVVLNKLIVDKNARIVKLEAVADAALGALYTSNSSNAHVVLRKALQASGKIK